MQDARPNALPKLPVAGDDVAAAMDGLCALAGPGAAALVRQIGADLAMLAARIEEAADGPALRHCLHDTRALAGTCGARALGAAADRLREAMAGGALPGDGDRGALAGALRALAQHLTGAWPR